MSATLTEIINRRKRKNETLKSATSKEASKKDESAKSFSPWLIVAVVVLLIIVILAIYWYWNRTPEKTKHSILEEMKATTPAGGGKRKFSPGTMSMEDFRNYESKFSMTATKDFL